LNPGSLIRDRFLIAQNYIKGWFLLDIVSILPFDMLGLFAGLDLDSLKLVKVFRLLRLAKLLRLLKSNKLLMHVETHYEIDYGNLQLWGFVFMLFALTHWLACGWCAAEVQGLDGCAAKGRGGGCRRASVQRRHLARMQLAMERSARERGWCPVRREPLSDVARSERARKGLQGGVMTRRGRPARLARRKMRTTTSHTASQRCAVKPASSFSPP
jgi:hypothetical protein